MQTSGSGLGSCSDSGPGSGSGSGSSIGVDLIEAALSVCLGSVGATAGEDPDHDAGVSA